MTFRQYYNVPCPADEGMPAVCVGVVYGRKDGGKPYLRFIVRRDLSVRLKSFTVVCRFSDRPVRFRDEANPYQGYPYSGSDINDREYIVWSVDGPEKVSAGCTAVVAKSVTEDGREEGYTSQRYTDPEIIPVDTSDEATISEPLRAYLEYRSAEKKAALQKIPDVPAEESVSPLLSLAQKAEASTVIEAPDVQTMEKAARKYKKKKLLRRHTAQAVSGILLLAVLVGGVMFLGSRFRPQPKVTDTVVSRLLDDGRYADAYKTAKDKNDTESLQNVCRTASSAYLFAKDYENAYLYASAAPEPFEREVIDVFTSLLITQNRHEEACEFLRELPQYTNAMQRVCQSAVDRCLAASDYAGAYSYAASAPDSLESYVMEKAAGEIVRNGTVNEAVFEALEKVLEESEDSAAFDRMASSAAEKLTEERSYREAAAIACQIRDENRRNTRIKDICDTGMKQYMSKNRMEDAAELYEFCSPMMDDASRTKAVQAMIDYCRIRGNTAGGIYFTSLKGGDTSGYEVNAEDESIRAGREMTWFLLTADQKRAYHAREMDLYKEAFRIDNGRIDEITDAVSVAVSENLAVVLRENGTVTALSNNGHNKMPALPADSDIVQIDVGRDHVVLLHDDGTVTAVGSDHSGQCAVNSWTEVTEIAAGADFTAGLRADGTLYACGSDISGQCEVDGITGVTDIAACDRTLILLMDDGTVRLVGDISMGLKRAENFTDVRRIRAGGCCIVAETHDGTYMLAQGVYNANCGSVITWKNLKEFAAGSLCIGKIEQNGSMKLEGDGVPITHPGYEPNGQ